jgi:hypothetical protein
MPKLSRVALVLAAVSLASVLVHTHSGHVAVTAESATADAATTGITFETPSVADPIHTFGEPDIGIDSQGRVFVSGPTGTGTQRSVWFGSVDGGHTFRTISPGPPPSALAGTEAPPGGGDTDIAFDRSGKQYFADLYALICLRTAVTDDGGATAAQNIYPGGCAGIPGADRQWLAVYDPAPNTANQSAYTGPRPLIYMEANNLISGAQWNKSNSAVDPDPNGPGLTYTRATNGTDSICADDPTNPYPYAPFGADGYPSIDQVTGKVFEAEFSGSSIKLNIGTPDASGNLTFLDFPTAGHPCGDRSKLITVATGQANNSGDAANFVVSSIDSARNLYVAWVGKSTDPTKRQAYVSVASAASGWTKWTTTRVSSAPSLVSIFPWVKAGGAGRADVVWYGSDKSAGPSEQVGQVWDVFMSQVVYPVDKSGAVTGAQAGVTQVKVTPHPMHYNDICLAGTGCIAQQGNRNLADFFVVTIDRSGAAEIVYDDTSNGLVQPGFTPDNLELMDHSGAGVVTVARQSSGPGLYGGSVSGPSRAPVSGISDASGDARYPVIGGANVPGMDILGSQLSLSGDGRTLTVTTKLVDLANPSGTASTLAAPLLHYVTRWQMGDTLYYASMENTSTNRQTFYAGKTQSVDLCSVSACFPHVLTYPEPGLGGTQETGTLKCPTSPSVKSPCVITVKVNAADVGSPTATSLLEEVGAYALATTHPEGATTNAQAQADNVPLEIDGACCFNFQQKR